MKTSTFSLSVLGVVVATGALVVDAAGAPVEARISARDPRVVALFMSAAGEAARDAAAIVVEGFDPDAITVEA